MDERSCDDTCVREEAYQDSSTYHCSIEESIVEVGICCQQLASQILCVCHVLEESDLHRVGRVVRQREGPYRSHCSRNGLVVCSVDVADIS